MGLTHPPFSWDLRPGERPIAQILGTHGYETHLFGFQHISSNAARLGFDGIHCSTDPLAANVALGSNVLDTFRPFVRRVGDDRPLYMEVNLEEPHRPYNQGGATPDESRGVFIPGYLPAGLESRDEMAALQGAITHADDAVGQLLGELESSKLGGTTIIIFAADHGIAMPRAKCTLYDPGLEVALMLRWPGITTPATVPGEMVSHVDILPTVLEGLDLPVPTTVQGHSFLPVLTGETFSPRSVTYAEKTYHSYYDPMRAIRTDRFKYIRNFETNFLVEVPGDVQAGSIFRAHTDLYSSAEHPPVELYDLLDDPDEMHNLARHDRYAEVKRWLDSRLWSWMRDTDDPLLFGPIPSPASTRALEQQVPSAADPADVPENILPC
jgi:arylsulfatase A-like enzyme